MAMDDDSFEESQLAGDRTHGASELARRGLEIAAHSALTAPAEDVGALTRLLGDRALALAATRPSMAPLRNLLERWRETLAGLPAGELEAARRTAADAARALVEDSRRAALEAAAQAAELVGAGRTVATHSLSSTVLEVFNRLKDTGVSVILTESRPLYEGHRLAARLSEWSIPATLITDAQLGHFIGRADLALVGADTVLSDGSVVNKAGSYLLALAARDQGVPFYVCCESFKWGGEDTGPDLEEMDPSELGAPGWPRVTLANVYFDVTPARLVTAWLTEKGVVRGSDARR
jgi:translation initiation factor 2B subunit (eIF-2B alpha/beta/delta family)